MSGLSLQMDVIKEERDEMEKEKVAFQQQCTTIIQNLQQMMNENSTLKRAMGDLQREHDQDQQQLQSKITFLQKECSQALVAKDAAEIEHRRVSLISWIKKTATHMV